jgi:hypothetical protein
MITEVLMCSCGHWYRKQYKTNNMCLCGRELVIGKKELDIDVIIETGKIKQPIEIGKLIRDSKVWQSMGDGNYTRRKIYID